jgi:hypothetical protein
MEEALSLRGQARRRQDDDLKEVTLKIQLEFKLPDLWIGVFWKRAENILHIWICLCPCFPIHIQIPCNKK